MSSKDVQLKNTPQIKVAYIELVGPYEKWGSGLMELKRWLDSKQVVTAGGPIGLFYDNPTETPTGELRSEACIPIKGNLSGEGKFKVKELPPGEIAVTRHTGPREDYTKTYGSFLEGLLREGYALYGPAREIFEEPRENLQPGMGVEIQQLVRKAVSN